METKSLLIKSIDHKTVTLPSGEDAEVMVINGKWEAFQGRWNADWKINGLAKGIFTTNKAGNKTYYNIKCPPELKKNAGSGMSQASAQLLQRISEDVLYIRTLLDQKLVQVNKPVEETPGPADVDPEPMEEQPSSEEINIEDIPF